MHNSPVSSHASAFASGYQAVQIFKMEDVRHIIIKNVWSPIVWKDGVRKGSGFLSSNICALDFDDGEMTLGQAVKSFCDMKHIIATTKSHQLSKNGGPPVDRFRVVLFWECKITDKDTYLHNMRKVFDKFPCDKACKDAARFFYPCKDIISVETEGYLNDVEIPKQADIELKARRSWERLQIEKETGRTSKGLLTQIQNKIKDGERNKTVWIISVRLTERGFTEEQIIEMFKEGNNAYLFDKEFEREYLSCVRSGVKTGLQNLDEERKIYDGKK